MTVAAAFAATFAAGTACGGVLGYAWHRWRMPSGRGGVIDLVGARRSLDHELARRAGRLVSPRGRPGGR